MSLFKSQKQTFLAPGCILQTCLKTCCPKPKMKNVIKHDINLDILLMGPIYVTKHHLFKENPKSQSSCQPHHPGSGTGMHQWLQAREVRNPPTPGWQTTPARDTIKCNLNSGDWENPVWHHMAVGKLKQLEQNPRVLNSSNTRKTYSTNHVVD